VVSFVFVGLVMFLLNEIEHRLATQYIQEMTAAQEHHRERISRLEAERDALRQYD
jgi:hypothetical protein